VNRLTIRFAAAFIHNVIVTVVGLLLHAMAFGANVEKSKQLYIHLVD